MISHICSPQPLQQPLSRCILFVLPFSSTAHLLFIGLSCFHFAAAFDSSCHLLVSACYIINPGIINFFPAVSPKSHGSCVFSSSHCPSCFSSSVGLTNVFLLYSCLSSSCFNNKFQLVITHAICNISPAAS